MVEHYNDTVGVTGSNPVPPTILGTFVRALDPSFQLNLIGVIELSALAIPKGVCEYRTWTAPWSRTSMLQ